MDDFRRNEELLVSAQFIPWELSEDGLHLFGLCDAEGAVRPGGATVEDPESIHIIGREIGFLDWARGDERAARTVADVPFPDGTVRCHLFRINDHEAGPTVRGMAVPLCASTLRRVADSSGELSRMALIEDATLEAIHCIRRGRRLACVILRVPEVDKVQTGLGSAVAELLLKEIALRLKHVLSTRRLIYELGMQAFAVLHEIEGDGEAGVAALEDELTRIAEQTFGYPYDVESMALKASGGIGYAVLPDDAADVGELLRAGEIASFHALLRRGEGAVVRCPRDALEENRENLILAAEFYETMLSDHIDHFIQPIVDTRTGTWIGGEILARWEHPSLGTVAPPRFIRLAEEYGYITDLTVAMIRRVAQWAREQRLEGLRLSFNIASVDFAPKEMKRLATEAVSQGLTDIARVVFEIVENTVIDDLDLANDILASLRPMGVEFALDDFGTGYSSIRLLQGLEIDFLKIDRAFTDGVARDERKRRLLRAIAYAAKSFDLTMIAEGVETEADLKVVRDLDIGFTQGYYFAHPMPLDEFAAAFARHRAEVA